MVIGEPRRPVVVGCGGLGLAVARQLAALGMDPLLVHRSPQRQVPTRLAVAVCDVGDPSADGRVFADAGVIFNCAAPPYGRWAAEYPALQAGLLKAARRSGAVLVDAQNTYLYGHTAEPFSEDQPVRPVSGKGVLRARLAADLLAADARGEVRVAVGRIVSFYGPHQVEGRLGARVFGAAVRNRRAKVLGNVDLPHSASYVEDAAAGLVTLGLDPRAWGRVWHLPAASALTTRRFLHLVYAAAGHRPRHLNPPSPVVRLAAVASADARELAEMLYMVDEPTVIDYSRFRAVFGARTTPHELAIADTVAWFRAAVPVAA
jgi:nucleoside-diphosphate-sugar epimerase